MTCMEKFMKISMNVPLVGIIVSLILLVVSAYVLYTPLMIASVILLHLSGWMMGAKFLFSGLGFFSNVIAEE